MDGMDEDLDVDELEYYVTFPTAVSPEFGEDCYTENEKEPVVFLFGWAGCNDRHLAKYSEMYKELGCVTIRYIAPTSYIFFTPRDLLDVADQLIDLITDLTLEVHPIVFHVFSNGGALVYRCFVQRLRERRLSLDVRATVYDSGPTGLNLISGFRALQMCVTGGTCYKWLMGVLYVVLAVLRYLWCHTLGSAEDYLHPWSLINNPNPWPEMFLYSHADTVTPAKDIETFMELRRARGVDVSRHVFSDSAHVLHYRAYPEEYRGAVASLLGRVCGPAAPHSSSRHRAQCNKLE